MSSPPEAASWSFEVRAQGTSETLTRVFDVRVPPEPAVFDGHFVGDPIVPGAMLLASLVLRLVSVCWPELSWVRRVTGLKFVQAVRPGDALVLWVKRTEGLPSPVLQDHPAVARRRPHLGQLDFGDPIER